MKMGGNREIKIKRKNFIGSNKMVRRDKEGMEDEFLRGLQ